MLDLTEEPHPRPIEVLIAQAECGKVLLTFQAKYIEREAHAVAIDFIQYTEDRVEFSLSYRPGWDAFPLD